ARWTPVGGYPTTLIKEPRVQGHSCLGARASNRNSSRRRVRPEAGSPAALGVLAFAAAAVHPRGLAAPPFRPRGPFHFAPLPPSGPRAEPPGAARGGCAAEGDAGESRPCDPAGAAEQGGGTGGGPGSEAAAAVDVGAMRYAELKEKLQRMALGHASSGGERGGPGGGKITSL
ncbi:unnamed protein product, partial [Prorocentrum cordatum]